MWKPHLPGIPQYLIVGSKALSGNDILWTPKGTQISAARSDISTLIYLHRQIQIYEI